MTKLFVFTITLENTSTGEIAPSMIVRKETEAEARAFAEAAIKGRPEIRVHSISCRAV